MLKEMNNDMTKLPLPIQARVLEPDQLIEDIKVANDELIVMEPRITFDEEATTPYAFKPQSEKRQRVLGRGSKLPESFADLSADERM